MSETLNRSPESTETPELPSVLKSRDLFAGDLDGEVSFGYNDAVIKAQAITGYSVDQEWFENNVAPGSDFSEMTAGEALDAFDTAYAKYVDEQNGKTPEQFENPEINAENPETESLDEQVIAEELANFDKQFESNPDAFPRAEFEMFVEKALLENQENATSEQEGDSTNPSGAAPVATPLTGEASTIEAIETQESELDINEEIETAREAFEDLVSNHPELESLRAEYMSDLDKYAEELGSGKKSEYELAA